MDSKPSSTASEVKNISMQETAEVINKLADLLDPSRHTVRKILLQQNPKDYFWECQDCAFHNPGDILICDICEAARGEAPLLSGIAALKDSKTEERSSKELVEEAVLSIQCPICLYVYSIPITLPCGHSLCVHHGQICRYPFSSADATVAKNTALCKNVKAVLELSRLADPDKETVRLALEWLKEK